MPKKKAKTKQADAAKQARYRLRASEANRKLRMIQYRCAAKVRLYQEKMGITEEMLRDENFLGEHPEICPFTREDPETIRECIRQLRNTSSSSSADAENSDSDKSENQSREVANPEIERNKRLLHMKLKRKLEEMGPIDPNDVTPEFDESELADVYLQSQQQDGQSFDTPTYDELVAIKSKGANKLISNDAQKLDKPQPSTSGLQTHSNVIKKRKLSNVADGDNEEDLVNDPQPSTSGKQTQSKQDGNVLPDINDSDEEDSDVVFYDASDTSVEATTEIFDERVPIHNNVNELDFLENERSDDLTDPHEDCDDDPATFDEMIALPNVDVEDDIFYDAVDEVQEEGEQDPREDNAMLQHGMNLNDFREALEKENQLPTLKERNHALYARFFFLSSVLAVTDRAAKAFWNLARSLSDRTLLSFKAIKARFTKVIPPVHMTYEFYDTKTKTTHQYQGTKFPRKKFPRPRYRLLCEWSTVEMNELYKFFRSVHKDDFVSEFGGKKFVDLFVDGVPLAKSSDCQMNVLCARFLPCRKVWPVSIHVYRKGQSTDIVELCARILQECADNDFVVRKFIGDSPMRAKMKCLKQHNGYCSCEWCYCIGKYLKLEKKMSFDADTMKYKRRTHEEWLRIASKIDSSPNEIADQDRFGIKGFSPLLQLNSFDIIRDFVPDPMHNISLGVGRALMGLILEINSAKDIVTMAGNELAKAFDNLWINQTIPQEFPRAPRSIRNNFKHLKASEFISIICCGFTHMYTAMKPYTSKAVIKTWLYFAYIVHSALMPDPIFLQVMPDSIAFRLQKEFYRLFEQNFSKANCNFNIHTFSHLLEIRKIGPLSDYSAMPFESYFSYLKKIIKPYTLSFAKSCLIKSFICNMNDHSCGYKVAVKVNGPKRTINNIICTRDGLFYYMFDTDGDYYVCNQIITKKFFTPEAPLLDWDYVYVKVLDTIDEENVKVHKKKILCKAVLADKVLISVPNDVYFT